MGLFGGKAKPKPEEAYQAAKSGNLDVLQGLLDKGCDPNGFKEEFVRRPHHCPRAHRTAAC